MFKALIQFSILMGALAFIGGDNTTSMRDRLINGSTCFLMVSNIGILTYIIENDP